MRLKNTLLMILINLFLSPANAGPTIGYASTQVTNISIQVIGTGASYLPGNGPTYITYGSTDPQQTFLFSSSHTFAEATALGRNGASTYEGTIGSSHISSIATASASNRGEATGITGFASTGSQAPGWPNLRLEPFTRLILSFDVLTSTDISGSIPGHGGASAGLRAHLGNNYIDVVSCVSSNQNGCDGLEGIGSSAHVLWTISSDESPLNTILYFNTSASVAGVSAVPELPTSALLLVGALLIIHPYRVRKAACGAGAA